MSHTLIYVDFTNQIEDNPIIPQIPTYTDTFRYEDNVTPRVSLFKTLAGAYASLLLTDTLDKENHTYTTTPLPSERGMTHRLQLETPYTFTIYRIPVNELDADALVTPSELTDAKRVPDAQVHMHYWYTQPIDVNHAVKEQVTIYAYTEHTYAKHLDAMDYHTSPIPKVQHNAHLIWVRITDIQHEIRPIV